ncbi:hypothetical protein PUNSTDRAFT_29547, partial [Punctularia strigosozonata HHB-11173 SS5]|uniref:uncharacterized protein n=1 Tax=Punctularia strigosozonata (strain HHB-11173) TaxID=741275 RepID=UPI00044167BF
GVPPLPDLAGDIFLEVFTHRSLRFPGAPMNDDFGDSERLAVLGAKVLEMITTNCLFCKKPMLKADEIEAQTNEILSEANVDAWLSAYKIREKLRCAPDALSTLNTPRESQILFNTYVGAVWFQKGPRITHEWIGRLIDPDMDPPQPPAPLPPTPRDSSMPYQPPPPPPLPAPVQAQVGMAYLPLFNQTASQRRVNVEWPATFSGPSHAGKWSVKCLVNGIERGSGAGPSKQLAKEDAAQQAFYAMGWGPRN